MPPWESISVDKVIICQMEVKQIMKFICLDSALSLCLQMETFYLTCGIFPDALK